MVNFHLPLGAQDSDNAGLRGTARSYSCPNAGKYGQNKSECGHYSCSEAYQNIY